MKSLCILGCLLAMPAMGQTLLPGSITGPEAFSENLCSANQMTRKSGGGGVRWECTDVPAGGGGEANTYSSLGGGLPIIGTKTGVDLPFSSLAAADFDLATNLVTIDDSKWATDAQAGGNLVEVSLALTSVGMFFSTTVTGQAWVTASSKIVCGVFGTTADGLTPEAIAIAGLQPSVANRVAGTGFDLLVESPRGLDGTVRFHCSGV